MGTKYLRACIPLLLLCLSAAAQADLHKWVDANGVTHYSEKAPPGQASTTVQTPTAAPPDDTRSSALKDEVLRANSEVAAYKRKVAAEEQQEAAAKKAAGEKKSRCAYEKNKLQMLQQTQHAATFDENGEKVYLSDAERQRVIEQTQKAISDNCN